MHGDWEAPESVWAHYICHAMGPDVPGRCQVCSGIHGSRLQGRAEDINYMVWMGYLTRRQSFNEADDRNGKMAGWGYWFRRRFSETTQTAGFRLYTLATSP